METIFDHGVTDEELVLMYGSTYLTEEIMAKKNERTNNSALYRLYLIRGDKNKAEEYASRIPDDIDKIFGLCNHDFAKHAY